MKIAHCYIDVVFNIIEYQKRDKVLCVVYLQRLYPDNTLQQCLFAERDQRAGCPECL